MQASKIYNRKKAACGRANRNPASKSQEYVRLDLTYDDNIHTKSKKKRRWREEVKENDLQTALKCLKIVFDIIWLRFFCLSPCISFLRVSPVCVVLPFNTFGHLAVLAVYLAVGICLVWRESRKKPFVALPPTTTTLSSAAVNLIYFNGPRVVLPCICGCGCVCVCVLVCMRCQI